MMSLSALRDALSLLLKFPHDARVELDTTHAQLPARAVGDIVQATVKAELANGRSVIEIDEAAFDVKLPVPARAGDTLRLQVLAVAPRLTLAWLPSAADATSERVAMSESARRLAAVLDQLVARTPPVAAAANGPKAGPAVSATLSTNAATPFASPATAPSTGLSVPGGSFTAASTSATPLTAPPATPAAPTARPAGASTAATAEATLLKPAAPVLATPSGDAAALAAGLKTALSRSGLFYESHQAQWIAGERPLPELMREPQATLSRGTDPVHPQAVPVVRQQLDILDTRQLVWFGQVWPDQSMEWHIEEDRRHASAAPEEAGVWKTSLRLTLPRLGAITALLSIQGNEVRIAFREVSPHTGSAMAGEQQTLRSAFDRAGLQLVDVKVERDET